jgi:hypothetical protein
MNYGAYCTSPTANFSASIYGLFSGQAEHGYIFQTTKTRMSLGFAMVGEIDGRILSGLRRNFNVVAQRSPWPLPSAAFMENYAALNRSFNYTKMPVEEQVLIVPLQLEVPKILDRLYYDPDISITLLFDPNESPNLAPELGATTQNYTTVTIVVVVVLVVVIALGILVFAKVVFPFVATVHFFAGVPLTSFLP